MNKVLESYIFNYLDTILSFEKELIKLFDLSDIPYNEQIKFPKEGYLQLDRKQVSYNFHGNGCTFRIGNSEIGYNIYPDRENYIATGPFEFMRFINSSLSGRHVNEVQAFDHLQELSVSGIVNKIFEDFLVYEINQNWYKTVGLKHFKSNL